MKIHIKTQSPPSPSPNASPVEPAKLDVGAARITVTSRPFRILDFDVEARPLHWISGDYVSKEITAIAWAWIGEDHPGECFLLGEVEPIEMLQRFLAAY